MAQLDEQAGRLLAVLTEVLPRAVPGRPETYIGYKDVHDRLGLPYRGETYGDSLNRQGLMSLAEWTVANNLPAITGLVINTETYRPGSGFLQSAEKIRRTLTGGRIRSDSPRRSTGLPFCLMQSCLLRHPQRTSTSRQRGRRSQPTAFSETRGLLSA